MPDIVKAIVNQPVPTIARPLLISAPLRPGETITIAAGDLPTSPVHDALFILQGPGLRAQRLVAASYGVAAGVVTIPSSLPRGTWILAAEDLSQLRLNAKSRPAGMVLLGLTVFEVP